MLSDFDKGEFVLRLNKIQTACFQNSVDKGFWPLERVGNIDRVASEERNKGEMIALMHSELSELLEGIRKPAVSSIPPFTNEEEELADLLIRAFDYAGGFNLRLGQAVLAKMEYKAKREKKHGKAF